MRDTVFCLVQDSQRDAISQAVETMVTRMQRFVPGFRLKQQVQFDSLISPCHLPEFNTPDSGSTDFDSTDSSFMKVSVFLEVEGAAHYLPAYAGNLDIMTSAALYTAESLAGQHWQQEQSA